MFKKKALDSGFNHLIAAGCTVSGKIEFSGCFLIESHGRVDGIIVSHPPTLEDKNMSKIVMRENSTVIGDKILATSMHIDGILAVDTIWCEDDLVIGKNARIEKAVIYHRNISIESGAVLINCKLNHLDFCSEGEIV